MTRAFRLGLFIITTMAVLAAGVFLIGDKQFLFSSTYRLNTTFKNVAGLGNGAEVRVGGVHTGTVKQIQMPRQADGQMYDQMNEATKQAKNGAAAFQEDMEALKHNFFVRGFFNKRGYEDSTKLTLHAIADLPRGAFEKKFGYDPSKLFTDTNSAKLRN